MPTLEKSHSFAFGTNRKSKQPIHHKSEAFMKKQIDNVKESQEELNSNILELEAAKSQESILQCRARVEESKMKSERDILILKILNKVNTELLYARADLEDALDYRDGDINAARKRVMWLEDRMSVLSGQSKLESLADSQKLLQISVDDSVESKTEMNRFGDGDNGNLMLPSLQQTSCEESVADRVEISENKEQTKKQRDNILTEIDACSNDDKKEDPNQTLITEVSWPTKSRVTILSPKREDTRQAFLTELGEESKDLAKEYWSSEHHRFDYGSAVDSLLEMDPLSYHQMGLAIPGSFLTKQNKEFTNLPWKEQQERRGHHSIHNAALDKLAAKVHSLHSKFYEATMLSVKQPSNNINGSRQGSFFQGLDTSLGTDKDVLTSSLSSKPVLSPSLSEQSPRSVTSPVPKKDSKHTGKMAKLVFYPKHIPPPDRLPLTRTNRQKEFPRLANSYAEPDLGSRKPAQRIVDQRNLLEETKLMLYTDKSSKRNLGTTSPERKFRMMLEIEKNAPESSSSNLMNKVKTIQAGIRWGKMKQQNQNQEYGGLRWERVKTLVHTRLVSQHAEERQDAAKHLGLLKCGDAMVSFALKERLKLDEDQRVRYEAAKSLILIGCWEEEILQLIIRYLVVSNPEIRLDLITTMMEGKNVQYVDKRIPAFPELVKVLSHFCCNPDPADKISFESAVLLGMLCVSDDNARSKLLVTLEKSGDTHRIAKSLDTLVKQLSCTDLIIVHYIEDMLRHSPVWKYRKLACDLLIILGPKHVCKQSKAVAVFDLLDRRLWDDPSAAVRLAAAKALTALGMFSQACDKVEKKLEDPVEDVRAQAVKSVGTLGMKSEKIIRLLLEMLELDSSDYVRLMIIRTFATLNLTDKRVLRSLREREKTEGPLARESRRTFHKLHALLYPDMDLRMKTSTPKQAVSRQISGTVTPLT